MDAGLSATARTFLERKLKIPPVFIGGQWRCAARSGPLRAALLLATAARAAQARQGAYLTHPLDLARKSWSLSSSLTELESRAALANCALVRWLGLTWTRQ
jgi:hypothetical protein